MNSKNKILIALCVLFIFSLGVFGTRYFERGSVSKAEEVNMENTITVNAEGIYRIAPDIANLSLGVSIEKTTAKAAQDEVTRIMNATIDELGKQGIDKKDMQTASISIYPVYDYNPNNGSRTLKGYNVSNTLNVKVKDLTKVGNLLDIAIGKGINSDVSINFALDDPTSAYENALKLATKRGEAKAKVLADSIGVKVNKPLMVSEGTTSYYAPSIRNYLTNGAMAESDQSSSVPIEAGQLEMRAQVTMVYKY